MLIDKIVGIDIKQIETRIRENLCLFGTEKDYFNRTIPENFKLTHNSGLIWDINLDKYEDDVHIVRHEINGKDGYIKFFLTITSTSSDGKLLTYFCFSNKEFSDDLLECLKLYLNKA